MRRLLLVVALVLALAPAASAQTVNKTVGLLPGGKTIGGPGAFHGAAGDLAFLFSTGVALNLCATLANAGAVDVNITLFIFGGGSLAGTVHPGQTHVICGNNLTSVSASCVASGGACKYMWRLDSL